MTTENLGPIEAEAESVPLVGRVARSGAWNVIAYIVTAGSAQAILAIAARILGAERFGAYSYITWIVRTAAILGAVGLPAAATRMVSESFGNQDAAASRGFYRVAVRMHLAVVPILFAATAAFVFIKSDDFAIASGDRLWLSVILGLASVFLSLIYTLEQALAGFRRFHLVARNAFVVGAGQLILVAVAVALGAGLREFLIVQFGGALLAFGVWGVMTHSVFVGPHRRPDADAMRAFRKLTGLMAVVSLSDAILWGRPEIFFLERFWSRQDVGLYSAALALALLTSSLPLIASRVLTPEFSWLRGRGREEHLRDNFKQVCTFISLVAVPLGIGGAIMSRHLLIAIFGAEYAAAATAASVLMAGSVFVSVAGPASSATVTGPKPSFMAKLAVSLAVLNLALDAVLIPRWSIVGAASATIVSQAISIAILFAYVKRDLGLSHPYANFLKVVLASLGAAWLALMVAGPLPDGLVALAVGAPVAAILYAGFVLGLRVTTVSEVRLMLKRREEPAV